ncbi:MAG: D-alanyl-D-alanine carboxypeptidase/D-alanyl-D-alanine-endopeptidase [Bdellovibrionaceae bacterium]|nr:D-alanyl-D-alanine carboxypeptidase/D-alanyl-D-alanine-endopeptidase [Pseudobdellovibrionaceae bacterium]
MKISNICMTLVLASALNSVASTEQNKKIEKVVTQSKISRSDLSLIISLIDNQKSETIYELNSTAKKIPASISKLATAAAVLDQFPPSHKFKTILAVDPDKISNEGYSGDLYIKGGGDPSFVSENMWFLVNQFDRNQINKIKGSIVVDDLLFDSVRFDESRQENRVDRAYDAPVGAMSFNWNSLNIFVRHDPTSKKPKVFLDPDTGIFDVDNRATQTEGEKSDIFVERKGNRIIVSGTIGKKSKEVVVYKNVEDPVEWSGRNLKLFLKQRGIFVEGDVKSGAMPKTVKIVSEYESKPIESILADMNKFSNNYVAEMLTKNLSISGDEQGNLKRGMVKINEYLSRIKMPKDQYYLVNPSGLTRENKMSARAMNHLLEVVHKDFKIFPEFLSSLPISGVDGTLKRRMKNEPAERWVRAKTGFLTGVVSLAGYAGRADGRVYQFTFIFNGSTDETRIRNFFDKILNTLIE